LVRKYSPTKNAAYCLPCYLFGKRPTGRPGVNAFTIEGFRNWKKVNDDIKCAFFVNMGNDLCSPYNNVVKCCDTLMNQSQHIEDIDKQTSEQKLNNRLRLKTLIDCICYLTSLFLRIYS
jgi:hypothetical protein